ncbi:MAG: tRNA adenosine deaminase-associated protein [Actinobacteria bacterium]|nr:tRNA adenosine deaminase-associated protein [Actinomycetota bacterium]
MSYFAAVLAAENGRWSATEVSLDDCESVEDIADVVRDQDGEIRLLVVEQDDEYVLLARVDGDDEARIFLSDGHAADAYPLAAIAADELDEIGDAEQLDDELAEDTPSVHDSAPFGDAAIVEDLGTSAAELLALCAHEGTLPIDVIAQICEKAGCADALESVRS